MRSVGARRILIVVGLALAVLLGLAWWVLGVEYTVDDRNPSGVSTYDTRSVAPSHVVWVPCANTS